MYSFSLTQVVDSPTHFSSSQQSSLIDLVFVSNMHSFSRCCTLPQLANSDHLGLSLVMDYPRVPSVPPCCRSVWRYNRADFDLANELLCETDFEQILVPGDIQASWIQFKTVFLDIMEQCIPSAVLPDRHNLPWLTKEIIQLIRKRDRYFKRARQGSVADRAKFRELRNRVVAKLRAEKKSFFADLESAGVNEFWKKIRLLNHKENSIPTLFCGDITASTNLDKAELLNDCFIKNFNLAVPVLDQSDIPSALSGDCPNELLCSEEEVFMLLSTLDCNKASGADDISAMMLKMTAVSISAVVTQLFNISISLGELPHDWKMARVAPIPKGVVSSDPAKFRPISLLSVLSKLLETHIKNVLLDHFDLCSPLSDMQWGFTSGKSTTGALLAVTDQWHRVLDSGREICTVFFDYSKAFDSVPHRPLLDKLSAVNVSPYILKWIASYLLNRMQAVCVSGVTSQLRHVLSGVPQGSVLGPLLFNFYINDITRLPLTSGILSLYADDMMLYCQINSYADFASLQNDVDRLCVWTNDNFLKFNSKKCKFMIISRKRSPTLPSSPIVVDSSPLDKVDSYKYLGVWITSSLSWSLQIDDICMKARRQIGFLYRSLYSYAGCDTFLTLYLSHVRPHLEYAAVVWDPHQINLINKLESVQKFALKAVTKQWKANYVDLLHVCQVPSLAQRRQYLKLTTLFKINKGLIIMPDAPVHARSLPRILRNSSQLLTRPTAHSTLYDSSFFPSSIALWNNLPVDIRESCTLFSFKKTVAHLIYNL